jgi:serine/threonine protein kinase
MKIGDLGISKPTTDTMLRTAIGTHGYMAPELSGQLPALVLPLVLKLIFIRWVFCFGNYSLAEQCKTSSEQQQKFLSRSNARKVPNAPLWLNKLISKCVSSNPLKRPLLRAF